uniref:Uncharacterized protein n=1 Tax=Romanomermis culicivorax TaxID=13658 RepID=A0A915HXA7_ROMCU
MARSIFGYFNLRCIYHPTCVGSFEFKSLTIAAITEVYIIFDENLFEFWDKEEQWMVRFCSPSKYLSMLGEQLAQSCARRTSSSTAPNMVGEHARRATSR